MAENVTSRFETTGMHCPSCSMLIKMSLADLDGVVAAEVDHRTGMTEVIYDPTKLDDDQIVAEVIKAGYGAKPVSE
jgi:Cu+-exporting ATPase